MAFRQAKGGGGHCVQARGTHRADVQATQATPPTREADAAEGATQSGAGSPACAGSYVITGSSVRGLWRSADGHAVLSPVREEGLADL
jgi:hypothetical protein